MNDEFAVEPTAFGNAFELKYLLEKFGFHNGRFIVSFPSKWIRQAYEHAQDFPEVEQARVKRLLDTYKKTVLISSGMNYDKSKTWPVNVKNIIGEGTAHFKGVIASDSNKFGYPTLNEVDADFFGTSLGLRILGTTENYVLIAKRLLQMSHEIAIVDPYLKMNDPKRKNVIQAFLEIGQKGNCYIFIILARYERSCMKTPQAFKKMLIQDYRPFLKPKTELVVKLIDDGNSVEKMHSRFILSELGGIVFDRGFDEFPGQYVDLAVMSEQIQDHHCRYLLDPNAKNDFQIIEEHPITGIVR